MLYYTNSNKYQKVGDLFCHVHISGLSHSVSNKSFENILKLEFPFAFRCSRCKWVQKLWLLVKLRHLKWDLKNSSNHKILFLHKGLFTNYVNKILAFFWPPTPLCWHFLWYECWQKVDIFGPPTYLVLWMKFVSDPLDRIKNKELIIK